MSEIKIITFRELFVEDAPAVYELLINDDEDYNKYFVPFTFEIETIKTILTKKVKDHYMGVYWGEELTGFFMLRGFDAGYEIPSYGVYIGEKYNNKGLATLTLLHAISTCKLLNVKKLTLKVHEENIYALNLYKKYGFVQTSYDEKINNLVMHKDLS